MDNIITGQDSVDDAVMLYRSAKEMFSDFVTMKDTTIPRLELGLANRC